MDGTGVPIATPFDDSGAVRYDDLAALAERLVDAGADFLVPCGSTGEVALCSPAERDSIVETVADAVDVPILAGTGTPGTETTVRATDRAATAGADAALVVTPYYHDHGVDALAAHYRTVAEESPIPVYLYSVPKYTGVTLDPETVAGLATHDGIAGMKDSSGRLELIQRYRAATEGETFSLLVGSGSVYAAGLDCGADGGILAVANVLPRAASRIYRDHEAGRDARARARNRELVELNHAVTARDGVPGLKAAMASRDLPGGEPRPPFEPVDEDRRRELSALVDRTRRGLSALEGE